MYRFNAVAGALSAVGILLILSTSAVAGELRALALSQETKPKRQADAESSRLGEVGFEIGALTFVAESVRYRPRTGMRAVP